MSALVRCPVGDLANTPCTGCRYCEVAREKAELQKRAQAVVDEHLKIYGAMGSFSKMGQLSEVLAAQETEH